MPRMIPKTDDMEVTRIPGPGTFQFSAVRPDKLGASEYTLVSIVVDASSSVDSFADDLLETVKSIIDACKQNPRSENLMVRLLEFNSDQTEIHGFKPLSRTDPKDYRPFRPDGMTALYDAAYSAVGATLLYAKLLTDQDFEVNGAVYIITDGMDNMSGATPAMIRDKIDQSVNGDGIESLVTVLVGLNAPGSGDTPAVSQYLRQFKAEAGLTQYVDAGNATPTQLARLAQFVNYSISSQSMALGSGSVSQPLAF